MGFQGPQVTVCGLEEAPPNFSAIILSVEVGQIVGNVCCGARVIVGPGRRLKIFRNLCSVRVIELIRGFDACIIVMEYGCDVVVAVIGTDVIDVAAGIIVIVVRLLNHVIIVVVSDAGDLFQVIEPDLFAVRIKS